MPGTHAAPLDVIFAFTAAVRLGEMRVLGQGPDAVDDRPNQDSASHFQPMPLSQPALLPPYWRYQPPTRWCALSCQQAARVSTVGTTRLHTSSFI
jgi:hypothetical protein